MILTDSKILEGIKNKEITIIPFDHTALGSNSYDIHLHDKLTRIRAGATLDCAKDNSRLEETISIPMEGLVLIPGILYLGTTIEYTETLNCVPFLEGKSSIGRLGISIHVTAGKGDIGFKGHWTLEISVIQSVRVYAGMPIGQIIYFEKSGSCLVPYDKKDSAKYRDQPRIPIGSMMHKNQF